MLSFKKKASDSIQKVGSTFWSDALSSGLKGWLRKLHGFERKGQHDPQTRLVVLKPQRSAMETRHRSREAQAQAEAGTGAGRLQADEALQHPAPLGLRNARPLVGHRDPHLAISAMGRDADRLVRGI